MSDNIRVLIADDHNLFREMLYHLINDEDDMEVVAEAKNGKEAVEYSSSLSPDVIVLDVNMPIMDGLEAIREIRKQNTNSKVVILTALEDDDYIFKFIREGATAYLIKDTNPVEMLKTIRSAHFGESIVQPRVMNKIFREFCKLSEEKEEDRPVKLSDSENLFASLTEREKEVLSFVAKGLNNKEIAGFLFISETTVKTHVSNLMSKLNMRDRVELVLLALRSGFSQL